MDAVLTPAVPSKKEEWEEMEINLVHKIASFENLSISEEMLPLLSRISVVRKLASYITRSDLSYVEVVEPGFGVEFIWRHIDIRESANVEEEDISKVKSSYIIMCFLCGIEHGDELVQMNPSAAGFEFASQVAPWIFALMFDGFRPNSKANLNHVCTVLDFLLKYYSEVVIRSLLANKRTLKPSINLMLHHVNHPRVADILVTLLCPIPRNQQDSSQNLYSLSSRTKAIYFAAIANIGILDTIAKHAFMEDTQPAALEVLQTCVEKFAAVPGGSKVLQGLADFPDILKGLLRIACGNNTEISLSKLTISSGSKKKSAKKKVPKKKKKGRKSDSKEVEEEEDHQEEYKDVQNEDRDLAKHTPEQEAALDTLRTIFELSTLETIQNIEPAPYTSFSDAQLRQIPCQLKDISEQIHDTLDKNFDLICRAILSHLKGQTECHVRHTSYVVKVPFSNYRLELVKLAVSCITHKPRGLLGKVPETLWNTLIRWFIEYPHCNLYHSEFRKLFMALLHNDSSNLLDEVLNDFNLLDMMIDYISNPEVVLKSNLSGHLLVCLNAIRLQATAVSPTHPLSLLLQSHSKWSAFLPCLCERTKKLLEPWVPSDPALLKRTEGQPGIITEKQVELISRLVKPSAISDADIALGSNYANEIGFTDIFVYDPNEPSVEINSLHHKKGRKANKRK